MKKKESPPSTSWDKVKGWYSDLVGTSGHYYHQEIILPGIFKLFQLKGKVKILDLACGEGVLARHLPKESEYLGVDLSEGLIEIARKQDRSPLHTYLVKDITKPLEIKQKEFTHASLILACQNLKDPLGAFQNAARLLQKNGQFLMVINHPCFRIPRQSAWDIDQNSHIQYRRVNRYMTPLQIPIQTHPGKGKTSEGTYSFHYPLSLISKWLNTAGFSIEVIEEWCSNKISTGKAAKMENLSRQEFPLFMAILAEKKNLPS